jgi:hypothetical protein
MLPITARAQAIVSASQSRIRAQLVWVDTDIGDDIDDAFALGLILRSPELHVLGISTAFGDTEAQGTSAWTGFWRRPASQAIPCDGWRAYGNGQCPDPERVCGALSGADRIRMELECCLRRSSGIPGRSR